MILMMTFDINNGVRQPRLIAFGDKVNIIKTVLLSVSNNILRHWAKNYIMHIEKQDWKDY